MRYFISQFFGGKFTVNSFWWVFWLSLLVSCTTSLIDAIGKMKVVRYQPSREAEREKKFIDYEDV